MLSESVRVSSAVILRVAVAEYDTLSEEESNDLVTSHVTDNVGDNVKVHRLIVSLKLIVLDGEPSMELESVKGFDVFDNVAVVLTLVFESVTSLDMVAVLLPDLNRVSVRIVLEVVLVVVSVLVSAARVVVTEMLTERVSFKTETV